MSTTRSLKRQSMFGYQYKNRGQRLLLHPEILTLRQKIHLLLMSTSLGRLAAPLFTPQPKPTISQKIPERRYLSK